MEHMRIAREELEKRMEEERKQKEKNKKIRELGKGKQPMD